MDNNLQSYARFPTIPRMMRRGSLYLFAAVCCSGVAVLAQVALPPTLEISNDRPLFLFSVPTELEPAAWGQHVTQIWATLPESLRPYSAVRVDVEAPDAAARHARYQALISTLQSLNIPAVVVIANGDPNAVQPLESVERILFDYTIVKGVWVADLSMNDYYAFGGGTALGLPPQVRWLTAVIETAAKYGRFVFLRLGEHEWPHLIANAWSRSLFNTLRTTRGYLVPIAGLDGDDTLAQQGMMMGLWLEGSVPQWGVECTPRWYEHARFVEPGVFGVAPADTRMPPHYYRAMVLNGAIGGATVYAFDAPSDLWFGDNARAWTSSIAPTLRELIELGLIPRKDFVAGKAQVAYRLAVSHTPLDMRANLRDIGAGVDAALMLRGAYGMEAPGQVPELVANTGAHYVVPILSPFVEPSGFARVVGPNSIATAGDWTKLLDQYLVPDGTGPAFVTVVGRSAFVMHTRENLYEEQAFRIPAVPAPVRGIRAVREGNTVTVTWPPREGDLSYRVYKRIHPDGAFELVADKLDQRTWTDPAVPPEQAVAYSVTALTNERAPFEGIINYGDYLALSMVYSRVAEEALITPLVATADSQPIAPIDTRPKAQEWWPNLSGVAEEHKPVALEIAARVEQFAAAFAGEDIAGIADVYSANYSDPQGWGVDYVRRAYQWFFERNNGCTMARQIRQWDFANLVTTGQVRVLLYCHFSGAAVSDAGGRVSAPRTFFPRTDTGEIWFSFMKSDGVWRIDHTEPALPNFRDLVAPSASPYEPLVPAPDVVPAVLAAPATGTP